MSFVNSIAISPSPLQLPMLPAFNRFLLSPEEAAAVANREREGGGGGATEQVSFYHDRKAADAGIARDQLFYQFLILHFLPTWSLLNNFFERPFGAA